jgi:hypothetical protein
MIKETVLLIYLINDDDDRVELVGVIPGLAKARDLNDKKCDIAMNRELRARLFIK